MNQVILHIGTHKTGTTSIQSACANNSDRLLEAGILYPLAGRPDTTYSNRFGHHVFTWSLTGKFGTGVDDRCWQQLEQEVRASTAERILLSAEHFSTLAASQIEILQNRVSDLGDVRVVLYLRNPLRFMVAAYKQQVAGRVRYAGSFDSFVKRNARRCNYERLVLQWSDVFGQEALRVRVFEQVVASDGLLLDFFSVLGPSVEKLNLPSRPWNPSASDGAIKLVRWLNRLDSCRVDSSWHKLLQRGRRRIIRAGLTNPHHLDRLMGSLGRGSAVRRLEEQLNLDAAPMLRRLLPPDDIERLRLNRSQENLAA